MAGNMLKAIPYYATVIVEDELLAKYNAQPVQE
jgi:hypothetical protein